MGVPKVLLKCFFFYDMQMYGNLSINPKHLGHGNMQHQTAYKQYIAHKEERREVFWFSLTIMAVQFDSKWEKRLRSMTKKSQST